MASSRELDEPMTPPTLSCVIPVFNDVTRIGPTLETLIRKLGPHRPFELVIVDDGSRDGTTDLVATYARRHPQIRLLQHRTNRGKGAAVRWGMLEATGQSRIFVDADLPLPL